MSTYPEPLVARSLGVNKGLIVATRQAKLEKGTDWTLVDSVVSYSPAGLEKLCGALGLDASRLAQPGDAAETVTADAGASLGGPLAAQPDPSLLQDSLAVERRAHNSEAVGSTPTPAPTFATRDPIATAGQVAAGVEALAKKSGPVWVEVTGIPGNRIIVHGRLEGRLVTVRVKNNATFIPGLWIQATPINDGHYYAQQGNPPRWKGDRHGFTKPQPTPGDPTS